MWSSTKMCNEHAPKLPRIERRKTVTTSLLCHPATFNSSVSTRSLMSWVYAQLVNLYPLVLSSTFGCDQTWCCERGRLLLNRMGRQTERQSRLDILLFTHKERESERERHSCSRAGREDPTLLIRWRPATWPGVGRLLLSRSFSSYALGTQEEEERRPAIRF